MEPLGDTDTADAVVGSTGVNTRVRKIDATTGQFTPVFSLGGRVPTALAVDGSGDVCLTSTEFLGSGPGRLGRYVAATGQFTASTPTGFGNLTVVATDRLGNVYLTESPDRNSGLGSTRLLVGLADAFVHASPVRLGAAGTGDGGTPVTRRGILYAPRAAGADLTVGAAGVTEVDATLETGAFLAFRGYDLAHIPGATRGQSI